MTSVHDSSVHASIARRELFIPRPDASKWDAVCVKYGVECLPIGDGDFKMARLPDDWSVKEDDEYSHYVDGKNRVVMTTYVTELGSRLNCTLFNEHSDSCFPATEESGGVLRVIDLPKRPPTPYWLFARVNNLQLRSPAMDAAWAKADSTTREWFAEKSRSLKLLKTRQAYLYVPKDMMAEEEETCDPRLKNIRARYESDIALKKIPKSTSYADYVIDSIDNEPYE
jgi:hypothetical protein